MTETERKSDSRKWPKTIKVQLPDGEIIEVPFGGHLSPERQKQLERTAKLYNEDPSQFEDK